MTKYYDELSMEARAAMIENLPPSSYADDAEKLPFRDATGKLVHIQALESLQKLNGRHGGVAMSNNEKQEAWDTIVGAIRGQYPNFVAPPRRTF